MPALRTDWKTMAEAARSGDFNAIGNALRDFYSINGDVTPGTVRANAAIVVDASKKIDTLTVTNMKWPTTIGSTAATIAFGAITLLGSSIAMTYNLAAPSSGVEVILANSCGSTFLTTVSLVSGSFMSSNANFGNARFDDPSDVLHLVGASTSRWVVVSNIGSVALSTS